MTDFNKFKNVFKIKNQRKRSPFKPSIKQIRHSHFGRPAVIMRENLYVPTEVLKKGDSGNAFCHDLMIATGMIKKCGNSTGIYSILPFASRILDRIEKIIDSEFQTEPLLAQKMRMPVLQPHDLWKTTDRWDLIGSELFRLKDRKGSDFCLGPTHEEVITEMISTTVRSWRDLPLPTKFRDEMRPRNGLLRSREFIMNDLYSFDQSIEAARITYEMVQQAYDRIFMRIGLPVKAAKAHAGAIGGNLSHEYLLLTPLGEDSALHCRSCDQWFNSELLSKDSSICPVCNSSSSSSFSSSFDTHSALELGHTFLLGTRYSAPFNASFSGPATNLQLIQMGCYGIGLSRLLPAIVQNFHDEEGLILPWNVAPFALSVLPMKSTLLEASIQLSRDLQQAIPSLAGRIVNDHRLDIHTPGYRMKDSRFLGFPYNVIVGRSFEQSGSFELEPRNHSVESKKFLSKDELIHFLKNLTQNE